MAHEGYHESHDLLSEKTKDRHRAIVSVIEELEAIDWYQQQIDVTQDKSLQKVLEHNRDEEKEHAAMLIEYLRRADPDFAKELKDYLFSDPKVEIVDLED